MSSGKRQGFRTFARNIQKRVHSESDMLSLFRGNTAHALYRGFCFVLGGLIGFTLLSEVFNIQKGISGADLRVLIRLADVVGSQFSRSPVRLQLRLVQNAFKKRDTPFCSPR